MSFYFVVLFFHISGALILFMGMSIEWNGTLKLNRSVSGEQAGEWVKFLSPVKSMFISGGVLLLITGIYLASAKWGWTAWIIVSFLLWLFLTIQGSAITGRKLGKLRKLLSSASGMHGRELNELINKLKLMNLIQSRLAIALGAVFIMTVKPDLVGSIIVVIIAIILGIIPLLSKQKSAVLKPEE